MTDCCFKIIPVQSNMTDNRNYKSSSLILMLLISTAVLILPFTSLSTSAIAFRIPSSESSHVSIADLQMGRRMDNEIEDYSETGANNRHDPPPPTPTQP
ncbi:uncharacterized protein LOC142524891 isoform X2 [Primulina tabacum]|uniref:uncharacterized protein LOC142524891 isoform X2 n=1 Tax=Primulina tabacum TaxID=48773 RepID=UPI003F5A5322